MSVFSWSMFKEISISFLGIGPTLPDQVGLFHLIAVKGTETKQAAARQMETKYETIKVAYTVVLPEKHTLHPQVLKGVNLMSTKYSSLIRTYCHNHLLHMINRLLGSCGPSFSLPLY